MEELFLKNCPSDIPAVNQIHQLHSDPPSEEIHILKKLQVSFQFIIIAEQQISLQCIIPLGFPVTKILTGANLRKKRIKPSNDILIITSS